ncbi:MAG TPA: hypothetical protein VMJ70_13255 [Candidatus Sulfotelmatobacter sp.]|nr:hypothetical protein [Candidatus Sulfotelmatobacter sp.]
MARTPRILLGAWVGAIVSAAALLFALNGWPHPTRELAFWLAACVAGELLWVRLPVGSATISMASCFNFAALLVLPQSSAMAVTMVSTVIAEVTFMRKPPVRAIFNAAQTTLAVAAGSALFTSLSGGRPLIDLVSGLNLLPFLAAAAAYYVVNRGAVTIVVAVAESISPRESWRKNFGSSYDLLASGAGFSLGVLLATHYSSIGMVGTLFVALPLVLACDGYRRLMGDSSVAKTPEERERRAA